MSAAPPEAPTPDDDHADRAAASPVRRALLRGVLVGAATSALVTLAMGVVGGRWRGDDLVIALVFSAVMALASAPAAWMELRAAASGRVSGGRALLVASAATLLSCVVVLLAVVQAVYAKGALTGDPGRGLEEATEALERLARWRTVEVLFPLVLPIGATTLGRLWPVPSRAVAAISVALGVGLAWYYAGVPGSRVEQLLFGSTALVLAFTLPPAAWLADRLDRRLWPPAAG